MIEFKFALLLIELKGRILEFDGWNAHRIHKNGIGFCLYRTTVWRRGYAALNR